MYCIALFSKEGKWYELFNMNSVVRSCHNWIVDGRTVKGGSQQNVYWMPVKCDPGTMLSNGAEWYYLLLL